MRTAFVFPGQGSQHPGMGKSFYESWPETRSRLDELSIALGEDLPALCFDATERTLRETRNTQPALFGIGLAVYEGLIARSGLTPEYVAGHSLGHFTALAAAGALDPADGVRLVRRRGEFLARASDAGTMLAVLLAPPETVTEACASRKDVGVGLYNGPRQTVISGTREGIEAVRERIGADGRARFRELDVGTAFHSPLMEPAVEPVERALNAVDLDPATVPVVSDVSCQCYTHPSVARRDLSVQVTKPVDWHGVVSQLSEQGVDQYVVFPPAATLVSLIERIDPDATHIALETPADAEQLTSIAEVSEDG